LTNFWKGAVEVYDNFKSVSLAGSFVDSTIPPDLSPFGISNINGQLSVTYAKPDAARADEVNAAGNGFVDIFDTDGNLVENFAANGPLNSPWGIAVAPADFSPLNGMILIGNFGDGKINAYDPVTGALKGPLRNRAGATIVNPGSQFRGRNRRNQ
jgi:uncharacterized protein (TIGR03118 family)